MRPPALIAVCAFIALTSFLLGPAPVPLQQDLSRKPPELLLAFLGGQFSNQIPDPRPFHRPLQPPGLLPGAAEEPLAPAVRPEEVRAFRRREEERRAAGRHVLSPGAVHPLDQLRARQIDQPLLEARRLVEV